MDTNFLAGVIEGFYGQPWSQAERFELFDRMANWGLNTYLYAPKDDLKHRTLWREPYSAPELKAIRTIIGRCNERNLRFVYGLSPGLDIRYGESGDLDQIKKRLAQIRALGCNHFALLFDDIPTQPEASVAVAQAQVANKLLSDGSSLLFCPTVYCGRMAERQAGGKDYLSTLGKELAPEINVFWTGPEIISREIAVAHAKELQTVLGRKPLIWDNLFANDYDGRRFFCGPYAGREPGLRAEVSGLLVNPNCEFPLNFIPLRTFGQFVHCKQTWHPREAYLAAMREWLLHFAIIGQPLALEDLVLFGDCYYLPHEEGPEAEPLLQAGLKQTRRLRDFCARLADLRTRSLFYALHRRAWELREELDLLIRHFESNSTPLRSDAHLPGTFRGGIVARLQRLLKQNEDGTFSP